MTTNNKPIEVKYSDSKLRILVEEYITMQKQEFTFKDLCSYVLYWAKEEGKTVNTGLYESNEFDTADGDCLARIPEKIKQEGRIVVADNNTIFLKTKE